MASSGEVERRRIDDPGYLAVATNADRGGRPHLGRSDPTGQVAIGRNGPEKG
jgi:hypothetical protein